MSNAHLGEELILYWPFKLFYPFWHLMPMGEKFRGFKGNGFILKFGLCLSVFASHAFHLYLMFCMVEYIVETLPKVMLDNVCNEVLVHHTCIYYGGVKGHFPPKCVLCVCCQHK